MNNLLSILILLIASCSTVESKREKNDFKTELFSTLLSEFSVSVSTNPIDLCKKFISLDSAIDELVYSINKTSLRSNEKVFDIEVCKNMINLISNNMELRMKLEEYNKKIEESLKLLIEEGLNFLEKFTKVLNLMLKVLNHNKDGLNYEQIDKKACKLLLELKSNFKIDKIIKEIINLLEGNPKELLQIDMLAIDKKINPNILGEERKLVIVAELIKNLNEHRGIYILGQYISNFRDIPNFNKYLNSLNGLFYK